LKEKSKEQSGARKLPIEEGCLSKGSVIIYVWRQKDTEIVAEQLNGAGVLGGVVSYHGGMDSNSRSRAQSKVSVAKYLDFTTYHASI
jgi:ATP-dependent DNA helicase Q4